MSDPMQGNGADFEEGINEAGLTQSEVAGHVNKNITVFLDWVAACCAVMASL